MSFQCVANRLRPATSYMLTRCFTWKQQQQSQAVEGVKPKRPKTIPIPRITLITDDEVAISSLDEAQKLAKRRDLKLVKIVDVDTKTQRPIYKLMTGAEYHAEDLRLREERKAEREKSNALKGEKLVIMNAKISEHDVQVHCNKIAKWIAKRYEVRVIINGDETNTAKAENTFELLEKHLRPLADTRILQKRQKGSEMRFQIVPPAKTDKTNPNSNEPKAL